ncbi:MAG: hypothetical protein ACLP9L_35970 [Thermoguttaceae bacterium]
MKIKTNVKSGGMQNHNQTLKAASGLSVKTSVKSGGMNNHNQTLKAASGVQG